VTSLNLATLKQCRKTDNTFFQPTASYEVTTVDVLLLKRSLQLTSYVTLSATLKDVSDGEIQIAKMLFSGTSSARNKQNVAQYHKRLP
jgi:hypothetical protein